MGLPDMSGLDLLERVRRRTRIEDLPFVLLAEDALSAADRERLRAVSQDLVVREVRSPVRLLDESSLFLHRNVVDLPASKQEMLRSLYESDEALHGKTVLVVDDDVRNIFALSTLLESHHMHVITANTGRAAIRLVEETPELALVLLDIMMPEMDGYETVRRIRSKPEFQRLPVIALTAKAMKGDREKCLEAGASDYIAKPVDSARLLSLLRMWLHR
jgi:CheY-like chemotaxis protein